jgi:predicted O-methyltransferase YrrM
MRPISLIGDDVLAALEQEAMSAPQVAIVEVGVYKGGSAYYLNRVSIERKVPLYLFDTFSGQPYSCEFDSHKVGDFKEVLATEIQDCFPDAIVVEGIFPHTLWNIGPIGFAHLDCDQYQSYRESCAALEPMMAKGGIMWFDDYCLPGAKKAIDEMYGDRLIPCIGGKVKVVF